MYSVYFFIHYLWRQLLQNLKVMGCNAIRTAHHVYGEEFLDLCDEMGFYVYEECFDKWTSGLYGRYFDIDWKRDLEVMVKRDRNRHSIIIWGVDNGDITGGESWKENIIHLYQR